MKKIWQFLKSRIFLINFSVAAVSLVIIFWVIFKWLDVYTRHGESVTVPDFSGKKISQLDSFTGGKNIGFEIIDSVYDNRNAPGTVIRQDPDPGTKVKEGRKVYLYVTSVLPPMVSMPKLEDRSLRMAVALLETYGLKFGGSKEETGDCNGCVIRQLYKGKRIEPGTKIDKGSVITLVVGKKGDDSGETGVPDVLGLTVDEARTKLGSYSLNIGGVVPDKPSDTLNGKIYRQVPLPSVENPVPVGSSVDVYISSDPEKFKKDNP